MKLTARTPILAPNFHNIPSELRRLPRWVVWRGDKVPHKATAVGRKASVTRPGDWAAFDAARDAYDQGGCSGVGFVLNGDGVLGVDLDNCVADKPDLAALALLDRIGCTYVELSPSGKGLRAFGFGEPLPKGRSGTLNGIRIELYSGGRYLTVTGHTLCSGPLRTLTGFTDVAGDIVAACPPTQETQDTQDTQETHVICVPSSLSDTAPDFPLPTAEGQRNHNVFKLARQLKSRYPAATRKELRPIVQAWHARALPIIGTKDFDTTWGDFNRAWDQIRYPCGDVLQRIARDSESIDIPAVVRALGYSDRTLRLVQICVALARHHSPEPFFLAYRTAGELLGCHFTDAGNLLSTLVADGVLERVSQGTRKRASEYRLSI